MYPLPVVNLGPDVAICLGQTLTLDGGVHDSYLWSDFSTNQTLTVGTTGNYSLLATDNGCQNSDEVFVNVTPIPISAFMYSIINLEVSFTNNSGNTDSFLWDFGDGLTSTIVNPVHLYSAPGNYVVSLSASNFACGTSISRDTLNLIETSVTEKNPAFSFSVYPNPSHGIFNLDIKNPNSSELSISIINSMGQVVYRKELNSAISSEQINLGNNPSGLYSIRLVSKETARFAKIIITK